MSKILGKQTNMVPTALGPMAVTTEYIKEYDIEDIVRSKAESQARIIQMINVAKDTPVSNDNSLVSTIYKDVVDGLEE